MLFRTFNEWSDRGYKIRKGSKGTLINNQWVFSENQVTPYHPPIKKKYYKYIDYDLEDEKEQWDCLGPGDYDWV